MKRKVGKRKKAAAAKIFLPKTSSYRRDPDHCSSYYTGRSFPRKKDPGKCKYSFHG
ncbi:MAG: hypothetical protein ACLTML_21250 [Blautia faecis]